MSNIGAYYSGRFNSFNNINNSNSVFCGSVNSIIKLWKTDYLVQCSSSDTLSSSLNDTSFLYFGGSLLRSNSNTTESDINGDIYRHKASSPPSTVRVTQAKQLIQRRLQNYDTLSLSVKSSSLWDMLMIDNDNYKNSQYFHHHCYDIYDNLKPVQGEVILYDRVTEEEVGIEWRDVLLGRLYAVVIDEIRQQDSLRHRLIVNVDTKGFASIVAHIWESNHIQEVVTSTTINVEGSASTINNDNIVDVDINLRVMTYNIWHNNPPAYLYDGFSRWKRYSERLRHLVSIIRRYNPDVLLLQEVRLDPSFRNTTIFEDEGNKYYDAGSQLDHLIALIGNNKYHSVFQPMMSFVTKEKLTRHEEGLAILSKYDIVDIDNLLLPRDFDDSNDNHQRGALCTKIRINNRTYIDFMTTHLSLSPESRIESVKAIKEYASTRQSQHYDNNNNNNALYFQIFGGDLNAEPNEESIKLLTKEDELIDTWLHTNNNNNNNNNNDDDQGFTFPTDDPIKRIDYIFLKNMTNHVMMTEHISVVNTEVVGHQPTSDTMHLIRPGIGMLDRNAPIYASDHLALFTDFRIKH